MNFQITKAILGTGRIVLILCLFYTTSFAGIMSSENYAITNDVLSSGGGNMLSGSYTMQATLGQSSPVGTSSSSTYSNHAGLWHFLVTLGDVNGDGKVDLIDVIRVLQVLTGQSPGQIYKQSDINGDGKLGAEELIYSLQKAAE